VMDLHPAGSMTSTHTGNPVCCAAALASIDLVVNENLAENARKVGAVMHRKLSALKSRFPQIGSVDGKGLVAGLACVAPGKKDPDADLAWEVVERCLEKGVLMFTPVGFGGATVKIAPPLVIHEAAVLESVAVLEEAQSRGRRVPEDLSIVGYDNVPEAATAQPPLTTIAQPILEKGRLAAHMIFERGPPRREVLPVKLVVRGTTAAPRQDSPPR